MIDADRRLQKLGPRGWTLLAATAFGIGGALTAVVVLLIFFLPIEDKGVIDTLSFALVVSPAPGIAGFIVGGPLWYLFVEARASSSERTGAVFGALTGLLAHFLLWLLVLLARVPGEQSLVLLDELNRVIVSGFFTLAFAGIFTVPAGAFIGWQLMRLQRSTIQNAGSEDGQ